jgi:hypothetical protein
LIRCMNIKNDNRASVYLDRVKVEVYLRRKQLVKPHFQGLITDETFIWFDDHLKCPKLHMHDLYETTLRCLPSQRCTVQSDLDPHY